MQRLCNFVYNGLVSGTVQDMRVLVAEDEPLLADTVAEIQANVAEKQLV